MGKRKLTVVFHRDFDGISAAGIFLGLVDFISNDSVEVDLQSIDYDEADFFFSKKLKEDTAILDFPLHKDAKWWFDHHSTSFKYVSPKLNRLDSNRMMWDDRELSCPSLILKFCNKKYPLYASTIRKEFSNLVKHADIIDSAKYENPSDVYNFDNDFIALNHIINNNASSSLIADFVSSIRESKLSNFFLTPQFKEAKSETLKKTMLDLSAVRDHTVENRNILSVNYLTAGVSLQRYAAYFEYPKAKYTVSLSKRKDKYYVGVGTNPWLPLDENVDISSIMRKYGGGGRKSVGAALFGSQREAESACKEIQRELSSFSN